MVVDKRCALIARIIREICAVLNIQPNETNWLWCNGEPRDAKLKQVQCMEHERGADGAGETEQMAKSSTHKIYNFRRLQAQWQHSLLALNRCKIVRDCVINTCMIWEVINLCMCSRGVWNESFSSIDNAAATQSNAICILCAQCTSHAYSHTHTHSLILSHISMHHTCDMHHDLLTSTMTRP